VEPIALRRAQTSGALLLRLSVLLSTLLANVLAAPLGADDTVWADPGGAASALEGGIVGDGSPGSCDEIALHNALAGGGTVTFHCGALPKQILIVHQQMITQATTINGGGLITITGGLATRLFNISPSASLELDQIALDSGATNGESGGAIVNGGALRLNQVTLQFSQTDNGHGGGAIYTFGPLLIYDSYFYKNQSGGGGAIYALTPDAQVEIHDTTFEQNQALATAGRGGAVWVDNGAVVHVYDSSLANNHSKGDGGAVYNEGTFAADRVVFNANTTDLGGAFGFGGAIASIGDLTLSNTYLFANASRYGGGLFVGQAAAPPVTRLQDTYVLQNQAIYSGGGLYASTTTTATTVLTATEAVIVGNWADFGGGLSINNAAVNIVRSAIGENHANSAGGLGNTASSTPPGLVRIYDSTIYSNVITTTEGGGLFNQGLMDLRNLTLEGNDSGVFNSGSGEVMYMANTVLHNVGLNCDGTGAHPASLGGNFSGDVSCSLLATGDVQGLGLNPLLSGLRVSPINLSQYFAPLPGSPLINTATFPCSPRDQLGALRPDACDKGAIEFHGLLPALWLPLVRR